MSRPPNGVPYTYPAHLSEAALSPLRTLPGNWRTEGGSHLVRVWHRRGRYYAAVYPMVTIVPFSRMGQHYLRPGLTVLDDYSTESEAFAAARLMVECREMTKQ